MSQESHDRYRNSLATQLRLQSARHYNAWLFNHARSHLGARTLEVGCALGNFTRKLIDKAYVCALDIENEYVELLSREVGGLPHVEVVCGDISKGEILRLKTRAFDSVLCFNVLEHIRDDRAALRHMCELLQRGGVLTLIVPAFRCLYGTMDATDNHYRRYTRDDLGFKLRDAGFTVQEISYFNIPGFFGWWVNGKLLRRRFIPFRQMLAYDRIIPLVERIEKRIRVPFGQSLFALATKGHVE